MYSTTSGPIKRPRPDSPISEDDAEVGMHAAKRPLFMSQAGQQWSTRQPRVQPSSFAGHYVEGAVSLNEMRQFIRQMGLRVNTNCGHGNRTKEDVFRDIQRALQRRSRAEALIKANELTSQFPSRLGNLTFELLRDDDGQLDLQALRRFIRHLNLPVATNCGAGRTKENLYEEIYAELRALYPDQRVHALPILSTCDSACHRCHTGTCVTNLLPQVRAASITTDVAPPSPQSSSDFSSEHNSEASDDEETPAATPSRGPSEMKVSLPAIVERRQLPFPLPSVPKHPVLYEDMVAANCLINMGARLRPVFC